MMVMKAMMMNDEDDYRRYARGGNHDGHGGSGDSDHL